MLKNEALVFSI